MKIFLENWKNKNTQKILQQKKLQKIKQSKGARRVINKNPIFKLKLSFPRQIIQFCLSLIGIYQTHEQNIIKGINKLNLTYQN